MKICKFGIATALISAAILCWPSRLSAGTPEETQLAGLIHGVLSAFIIAEFGGRTIANPHYNRRPVCTSNDYNDLRESAKDNATLVAFHSRCRLVETKIERMQVHGFAYLPPGHCDPLKNEINKILARQIHAIPLNESVGNMSVEYKGIRIDQNGAYWDSVRAHRLAATCENDGSIRLTGDRNRDPARLTAEDASATHLLSMIQTQILSPTTIGFAALMGLFLSGLKPVLGTAAIVAIVGHLFYFAGVIIVYPDSFGGRWPLHVFAAVATYVFWATAFFTLKRLIQKKLKRISIR